MAYRSSGYRHNQHFRAAFPLCAAHNCSVWPFAETPPTVLGFGVAALLIGILNNELYDSELWQAFAFFILTATLLGWAFIAMAYVTSVIVNEKSRATGIALIIWFWFVLIFDLIMLGLLVMSSGNGGGSWLPYLMLLNPTDIFRLANLSGFEATRNYTGLAQVSSETLTDPIILTFMLALWVIIPLLLAIWLFNRRRV